MFLFSLSIDSGQCDGTKECTELYRRLESIGLNTRYVRKLVSHLEVEFAEPTSTAQAEWRYIVNNLRLPIEVKEETASRIKFDIKCYQMDTIIHELCHASLDMLAQKDSPLNSPERNHYDVVNSIWADLYFDDRHKFLGHQRYPRMKADEICAYYVGGAVNNVFAGLSNILRFNIDLAILYIKTPDDADRLGSTFILPSDEMIKNNSFMKFMFSAEGYDAHHAGNDTAYFQGKAIPWNEREFVKRDMFDKVLDLRLPHNRQELCSNLNAVDNSWIKGKREELLQARKKVAEKVAKKLAAAQSESPAPNPTNPPTAINLLGVDPQLLNTLPADQ